MCSQQIFENSTEISDSKKRQMDADYFGLSTEDMWDAGVMY